MTQKGSLSEKYDFTKQRESFSDKTSPIAPKIVFFHKDYLLYKVILGQSKVQNMKYLRDKFVISD